MRWSANGRASFKAKVQLHIMASAGERAYFWGSVPSGIQGLSPWWGGGQGRGPPEDDEFLAN